MTAIPSVMTAIEISKPGGPEMLVANRTRAVPAPGPGEVLIKVAAAGVNRPDLQQRAGSYAPPPGASDLPGLEVSGEVVALGQGASGWKIGDKVCALTSGGGYAQYCVTAASHCLPVPKSMSPVHAGGLAETYFTVWTNVFDRARLKKGETILIHGGASGIGTTAIQMCHAFGATVFATVGSDDKIGACEKLGARKVINYRSQDFVEIVQAETGGKGVNVVLDMVAGEYVQRNLNCLALEGRLAIIAVQGGLSANFNVARFMVSRQTMVASTLRAQSVEAKAAMATALRQHIWPLLDAGTIKPIVFKTFPLEQAAQAHAELEKGAHIGKIILTV